MPRDRKSLQYELMQELSLDQVKNNSTRKSLIHDVKAFAAFCKTERGIFRLRDLERPRDVIQAYTDDLVRDGHYSPASIHRLIAAPCRALDVNMGDIDKPRRTQSTITRGRRDPDPDRVEKRGDREERDPRFARPVAMAKAVGIRRAELGRLRGRDLVKDEAGYDCVRVERGKGGKDQLQRILPEDLATVRAIFAERAPDQRVFAPVEMKNHINFHGMRGAVAKHAYAAYEQRLASDPSYGKTLVAELSARYRTAHPRGTDPGAVQRWFDDAFNGRTEHLQDIVHAEYRLRGENLQRARKTGRPVVYNRLALLAVSVFHLSHWRLDVTVTNYMLA